jgi:hypothetical protein
MRRAGQQTVPDLLRDRRTAFDAPAGTGGRKRPGASGGPGLPTRHRAGHRFRASSSPGARRQCNLPGSGVAPGARAAAGFDRRNYHYQKSSAGHCVIVTGGGTVRWVGTGYPSARNWRRSGSACDSRHGRGRNQPSFLPAAVSPAGSAIGGVRRVNSAAGGSTQEQLGWADHLARRCPSAAAPRATIVVSRQLVTPVGI